MNNVTDNDLHQDMLLDKMQMLLSNSWLLALHCDTTLDRHSGWFQVCLMLQ